MLEALGVIFLNVLLPVLVMVALGAAVQRYIGLDMKTLTRLNIWLCVPAFLFVKIYESDLTWLSIGNLAAAYVLSLAALGLPLYLALRLGRARGSTVACCVLGGLVYNAGNFGIPVAELLYQKSGVLFPGMDGEAERGLQVQALIVMLSNLSVWLFGYVILALAKGDGMRGAMGYLKLPMLYALVLAFVLRHVRIEQFGGENFLPGWIDYPLRQLALMIVPVALITLGAQLAANARWPRWRIITPMLSIKLLALPAVTGVVVYAMGLWPWPGAQLIIAAAAPTAVNTLLLTIELDGDAELQADVVFWTTVFAGITSAVVIAVVVALGAVP
jgi:predicted permease